MPLRLTDLFNIHNAHEDLLRDTTFVGIDFGTSTTVVSIAVYNPRTSQVDCQSLQLPQKDKNGEKMLGELFPTAIAQSLITDKPIFGQGAYDLKWSPDYTFGINIWHSFKMELGKDLGPRWYDSRQSRIRSPQDATKVFFKFLKRAIEKTIESNGLPTRIKFAVSIPASFESNQRKDLLEALRANDIQVDGSLFIDEPNAAFLGYINSGETEPIELSDDYNPKVLVFDFGAGTCDISILEITADYQGMHSNNLSISQFEELGGNDIDRYIAYNFLLPQLLRANDMEGEKDMFTTKQKEKIVQQLLGYAENLKQRLCENDFHYLLSDPVSMDEALASDRGISVDTSNFSINTDFGPLAIPRLSLSYKDFIDTMKVFFKKPLYAGSAAYTVRGQQKKYNSIQAAIHTALAKAHVEVKEIGYVIMIGGSSKNPFVQQRIKSHFPDAKVMIPRELQALVSQGTAIHSLLSNGLGIQAVRPIVGEPILIVTQNGNSTIIKAGTGVPFIATADNTFTTGNRSFQEIEIPVCVGSDNKMLYNLKIRRASGEPFPENTPVTLIFKMDCDKILHVKAKAMGESWEAICENPLDNAALTDGETKVLKAQRESYVSSVNNGNRPTAQALENLCRAYQDNDQEFLAAETLEEKIRYYPDSSEYNRIGVLYHNSGNYNRAIKFYEMALKDCPDDPTVMCNLGHNLYLIGEYSKARTLLERAVETRGDDAIAITKLAKLELIEDNNERAEELFRKAFNIFTRKWKEYELDRCSKGWFIDVAEKLGEADTAQKLREELRRDTRSRGYSIENTLFENENK